MRPGDYYKLDNVGNFYSLTNNKKIPPVFRYSVELNKEINKEILQEALEDTIDLFPNFNVTLKKGFFWSYLEYTNDRHLVKEEDLPVCYRLYTGSDSLLYRVSYYKKRINFELSHIVSDGRGSLDFFKTLIYNYIKLLHPEVTINTDYIASDSEKNEDSFDKYYKKPKFSWSNAKSTYRYKGKKLNTDVQYMEFHLDAKKTLELAKSYNVSLTALIISVLLSSIRDEMKLSELNKTVKIDVPVDLRNYFPSLTSKNFFGLITIVYKFESKEEDFNEIIKSVSEQLKQATTKENLAKRMNKMMFLEKNVISKFTPLLIKELILSIVDNFTEKGSTTTVSNLGRIEIDPNIQKYISEINVLTSTSGFQFTMCTFNNKLSIGISSIYKSNNIVKNFCRYFTNHGIDAYINTNAEEI